MVKTGGTLSSRMIELVGDLNQIKTLANIKRSIRTIEKDLQQQNVKVKINAELFGKVEDMRKGVRELQKKLDSSPQIGKIKLGVELKSTTKKDINAQIKSVQDSVNSGSVNKLKMDIDFNFKGSASKIKAEMKEISDFVNRYSNQLKGVDIVNLDKDAQNVQSNTQKMTKSIGGLDRGTKQIGDSIEGQMRKMTGATGKFSVNFKQDMNGAINGATASIAKADGTIGKFNYTLNKATGSLELQSRSTKEVSASMKELEAHAKRVESGQKALNKAMANSPKGLHDDLLRQAQSHLKLASATDKSGRYTSQANDHMAKFTTTMTQLSGSLDRSNIDEKFKKMKTSTQGAIVEFQKLGGSSEDVKRFESSINNMTSGSTKDMDNLETQVKEATRAIVDSSQRIDQAMSSMQKQRMIKAVDQGDIESLKKYVGEMYGARVETIKLTETKDKLGRAINRMKVEMQGENGVAKSYTLDMEKGFKGADRAIRQTDESTKTLKSSVGQLDGTFGKLALRIAEYFSVIRGLQLAGRALRETIREIRDIDAKMIELQRVASPSINTDVILQRSIVLSKELGSTVKEVVGSIADMARTFGEFNEEQLIAITRTASIMDNVSDLSLEQSSGVLVGAMKAFNITAEDSIRIVDSLNEVDNNYAISTQQLADAVNRTGSAAQTFGVDLEELAGDITAVGSITQESGQRIGTALRTIYSRITTIDAVRPALEGVGISLYEIGQSGTQIRDVSDILGDLGDSWNTLTAEQQQNLGVTIAGRARVTQFLALMNNYETAIDATATAYNSQGSAIREQKAYMESYEYQMKVMGSTASELALVLEDKLVGDAMYLVIEGLTSLLELTIDVVDKFGVLGPILGIAGGAWLKFGGGVGKTIAGMGKLSNLLSGSTGMIGMVGKLATKITVGATATGKLSLAFKGLASGGVMVAVVAIGFLIEKLVKYFAEQKRLSDEAKRVSEEAITTYNEQGRNLSDLVDRYEELDGAMKKNKDAMSTDEINEYNQLVGELTTILPQSVSYIDAQGEAHLRSTEYIKGQVAVMGELAEANAELILGGHSEELAKQVEDIQTLSENIDKLRVKVDNSNQTMTENYEDYVARIKSTTDAGYIMTENVYDQMQKSEVASTSYSESVTDLMNKQYLLQASIQESTIVVGEQVVSLMNARGEMSNVSTVGESLIRNYSSLNSSILETSENTEEGMDILSGNTQEFGQIMKKSYDDIALGMDGIDTEDAIESFDALVKALPEDFFNQTIGEIESGMGSLSGVINDVMTDAELDVNLLIQSLVDSGIEMELARTIVANLGQEFENQSIQTALAEDELVQYNDELAKTKDLALETINPLAVLFGISKEDAGAMDSHIQLLQIMRQEYGNVWSEMDGSQHSVAVLAESFNQSEEFIIQNVDTVGKAIRAINGATVEVSEETGRYVYKFSDDVDDATKVMINGFLESETGMANFTQTFASNAGVVTESEEKLKAKTEELNETFKQFNQVPDVNNYQILLREINTQLGELEGTFVTTQDEAGNLKLTMADGTQSEYLNNLNEKIKDSGLSLFEYEETFTNSADEQERRTLLQIENLEGQVNTIMTLNEETENGLLAISKLEESFQKFKNGTLTEEEQKTFVQTLDAQIDAFGDNLVATKDEAGDLKLEFSDGSSSPWLEALNTSIGDSGLKIKTVEDKLGNLKLSLVDEKGNVFFSGIDASADKTKEKVGEVEDEVDRLNRKARGEGSGTGDGTGGPAPIMLDNTSAISDVREVSTVMDEVSKTKIDLKIDDSFVTSYNDVVDKIGLSKIEIADVEGKLAELERNLRVTGENLESIMTNISTVSEARSAVRNLIEDIKDAKSELGLLYQQFAEGNLDTSTLTNASSRIADEALKIKDSFNQIVTSISRMTASINNMTPSFNIVPVTRYRAGVENSTSGVISALGRMANGVNGNMKIISNMYKDGLGKLVFYRIQSDMQVQLIMRTYDKLSQNISMEMTNIEKIMHVKFLMAVTKMMINAKRLNETMKKSMQVLRASTVGEITSMTAQMVMRFKSGTDSIVNIASSLPRRIGDGVRANMESATSSMTSLANSMVKKFKTALGIHSPSRVFEGLGGYVIDGLVNGLTDNSLTGLGQNVFSDFSDGAISTIDQIKGYMTFEPVTSGSFGSEFRRTSGYGKRSSPEGIGSTNHQGVDYGAPAGTPIRSQSSGRVIASGYNGTRGNYVIVESQGSKHLYQHNSANTVRSGQMIGKGQTLGTVGSTGASTGSHLHYEVQVGGRTIDPEDYLKKLRGYANGGFVDKPELAWHGEEGLEAIIPLVSGRRERGIDLWGQAGEKLGMNAEMLELLLKTNKKTSSYGGTTTFAGLDGEAGSGDSSSGTSGVIKPDISSVVQSLGIADQPMFSGLATDNEMESLYRRNMDEVKLSRHNAMITKANTELTALTEQTLDYRNALKEVTLQESRLRNETDKQLKATVKRQAQIEKELGKLRNTSKHTEKQRISYNKLQQEFDKNTESIYSMENQLRQLNIGMDERKVAIYTDYIGQLNLGFQKLKDNIADTKADLEFALEKTQITDENNMGKQLEIQYDILKESIKMENTLMNNMNKLQSEYGRAVSKYGKDSEQALLVKEETRSVEEAYQGALIERLKLEQTIEGVRADVAEEGIGNLKDYYNQTQTMTERAIELERKSLEEAHDNKMSMYDEEINKISSIYDARLNEMDEDKTQKEYQDNIAELNAQRADLMMQVSRASRDNSLEGKKRLAEFQSELAEVNTEIEKTQSDRQDDLYKQSIERQRDEQISALEIEKQSEEQAQELRLSSLDKQIEDAKAYTERMVGDEVMWKNVKDQFVSGNTNLLNSMIEEMTRDMSKFMSGNYSGVSMGYGELSDSDKETFDSDTLMEVSNMMLSASDSMEKFASTTNKSVENIGNISGGNYNAGSMTTWSGSTLSTQGQLAPNLPTAPKPAPKPVADNRHHTVSRGDTLWDIAQKYYGNPYQWTKIAQANENPDPRKLQVGRKLLVPFKTGGFTGDWMGDSGRMAILHKKELVLNESQTKDILNVAKMVDGIMGIIPKFQVNKPNLSTAGNGNTGDTYVIDNLNLNMNDFKGSRQDARNAFDNMAKELKKRGKK